MLPWQQIKLLLQTLGSVLELCICGIVQRAVNLFSALGLKLDTHHLTVGWVFGVLVACIIITVESHACPCLCVFLKLQVIDNRAYFFVVVC